MEIQIHNINHVNGAEFWSIKWEAVAKRPLTLEEYTKIDDYIQKVLNDLKIL